MKRILGVDVSARFARVTGFALRNVVAVGAAAGALVVLGLVLALGLSPSASPRAVSGGDSSAAEATTRLHRAFGDEPVVILVRGQLTRVLLSEDVQQLLGLEGCISGNLPAKGKVLAPVCREFARLKPIQVVYGPGTFINDAAGRILDQVGLQQERVQREADRAARAAIRSARAQGLDRRAQLGAAEQARTLATTTLMQRVQLETGLASIPALNNPRFVLQLVFTTRNVDQPKSRFAYVAPGEDAALIQARLRPDLSASEREHAIAMLREAVASRAFTLKFGDYVVTGDPVLRAGVASGLSHQAAILLAAAILFVAVALLFAFRARLPVLPLVLALVVAAIVYGLARVTGASLSIPLVALLPMLIGLVTAVAAVLRGREGGEDAPRVATAGLVIAAGLIALLASPVPAMRGSGALLAAGVVLAFVAALSLSPIALARLPTPARAQRPSREPRGAAVASWMRRSATGTFRAVLRRPQRTLLVATAVAVLGWALGTRVDVVSDLTGLAPSDRQEVEDANALRDASGSEGQVSVLVRGRDLSDPRAIAWMSEYQGRMLVRHGYSERKPCRQAELCPALSLTNIFGSGLPRTERRARAALRSLPRYFARNVISPDRRTASIWFVLSKMSPDRRQAVIDDMRRNLDPPAGVTAELAGGPVLEAADRADLEQTRWTLGLTALLLVFATLFAVYRRVEHTLAPLVPAVLATGWTMLLVWILGVPLNPVSAAFAAIILTLGAGFGSLLYTRYGESRAGGRSPEQSLESAWRAAGPEAALPLGVLAAALLALTVSDFPVFRDLGVVLLAGLALELVALLLVLPATLLVAEEGVSLRLPRTRAEALALARGVGRRTRPAAAGGARAVRSVIGRVRKASPLPRK